MLVLSRRERETLLIGEGAEQVEIKLIRIGCSQVKIGIEAPAHISIRRGELDRESVGEPRDLS